MGEPIKMQGGPVSSEESKVQLLFGGKALLYHPIYNADYGDAQLHVIEVFLKDFDIVIDKGYAIASTTHFLENKGVQIAINGLDGFADGHLQGIAMSEGQTYNTQFHDNEMTLYISKDNKFSFNRASLIPWNATSFPNLLVVGGEIQPIHKALDDIRARTAFGIDEAQERAFLVVVDGKDYWSHVGLNFQDTAKFMKDLGCHTAVMGDGGGSTTMVIEEDGKAKIVNVPCGENADGQRSVAQHMGFRLRR